MAKKNRIGEIFETSEGYEIKIIEYNNNDEYKGRIPDRLYEAMYNWKVDIDD